MEHERGFSVVELVLILVVVGLIIFAAVNISQISKSRSGGTEQSDSQQDPGQEGVLKGVNLSPKSFDGADFSDFFEEAAKHNSVISWAGPWTDIDRTPSPAVTVAELAGRHGYQPMIITSTHGETGGSIGPLEPLTQANKGKFIDVLADFASEHKPPFIGIGNEVNRVYDHSRSQYDQLAEWFEAATQAIKGVSSDTKVFVVFQYEQLLGLHGGLFGGVSDESDTDWDLLDDFPSADIIAFTSYPYLIYKDPADIPSDYYSMINSRTDKTAAFTELSWPSGTEAPGWASSPQEQSSFISRFESLAENVDVQFVIWPFLYDQNLNSPFSTISLIDSDGSEKAAYKVWQQAEF